MVKAQFFGVNWKKVFIELIFFLLLSLLKLNLFLDLIVLGLIGLFDLFIVRLGLWLFLLLRSFIIMQVWILGQGICNFGTFG